MTISAALIAEVSALSVAVTAAAPLNQASKLLIAALQTQGAAVLADTATALTAAAGALDAGDPTGFPGNFVGDLLALAVASEDQTTLADLTGLVGRAMFNLSQANA